MKFFIVQATLFFVSTSILLVGCSGCSVKNGHESVDQEQRPLETVQRVSKTPVNDGKSTQQEIDVDTEEVLNPNERSPLIFQTSQGHALYPFERATISKDIKKLANAEVVSRLAELKKKRDYSEFEYEETMWKGRDSVYEAALGTLKYAQYYCYEGRPYRAYPFAAKALAENPNDFETLLTWVYTYHHNREANNRFDDEDRVVALRRLNEMNPNQPYVLQELAKAIYPVRAAEALGYAKKAMQLDYRYSRQCLDGVCYFQLGAYEKALAAHERVYADANDASKSGPANRIKYIQSVIDSPELQQRLEKFRSLNEPLLSWRMGSRY